jgi:hypothetical protein
LLAAQWIAPEIEDYIERMSLPGRLSGGTVELFFGQSVSVIEPRVRRGMYGWCVNSLVSAALETLQVEWVM